MAISSCLLVQNKHVYMASPRSPLFLFFSFLSSPCSSMIIALHSFDKTTKTATLFTMVSTRANPTGYGPAARYDISAVPSRVELQVFHSADSPIPFPLANTVRLRHAEARRRQWEDWEKQVFAAARPISDTCYFVAVGLVTWWAFTFLPLDVVPYVWNSAWWCTYMVLYYYALCRAELHVQIPPPETSPRGQRRGINVPRVPAPEPWFPWRRILPTPGVPTVPAPESWFPWSRVSPVAVLQRSSTLPLRRSTRLMARACRFITPPVSRFYGP